MFKKVISYVWIYLILLNLFSWLLFIDNVEALSGNSTDDEKLKKLWEKNIDIKNYAKDRLIIKYKDNIWKKTNLASIQSLLPTKTLNKLSYLDNVDIWILYFDDKKEDIDNILNELKKIPSIEYVEKDYSMDISYTWVTTNDVRSIEQWYLKSIQADESWKIYNDNSNKTIVWINDTWLDYTHPDLVWNLKDLSSTCFSNTWAVILWGCPNYWRNFENQNINTVFSSNETFDINWHGTHVAWIIWAVWNNWTWVIWVTQNVEMISSRLETYNQHGWYFYISNAIEWLNFSIENWAKIVNASYGSTFYSSWIYDSIVAARDNWVILVAAAWNWWADSIWDDNDWWVHFYPSDYNLDNIISVASLWENDSLAPYSNYWLTSVDISAPGWNFSSDSWILSTFPLEEIVYENDLSSFSWTIALWTSPDWYLYSWWLWYHTQTPLYYTWWLDYSLLFNEPFSLSWAVWAKLKWTLDCDFWSGSSDADFWDSLSFYIYDNDLFTFTLLDSFYSDYIWTIEIPLKDSSFLKDNLNIYLDFVTDSDTDVWQWCRFDNLSIVKYSKDKHTYKALQWTSMAAPVVTWVASMIWSYKPELTYLEVKDIILSSVDTLWWLSTKIATSWKVNAKNAIKELISRYGITKNWDFEWETFNTPDIILNWKDITLSGSIINITSTWTVMSLSWSTVTWSWIIKIWTWTTNDAFSTSNNFNIVMKNNLWTILNLTWSTIFGDSLMVDYTWGLIWTWVNVKLTSWSNILYDWILWSNIIFPINYSFSGAIDSYVYSNWDLANGISTWVILEILDKNSINNINFEFTPPAFTWSLDFSSGSITNNTWTIINLASTHYPVDYNINWDLIWTYTWTLNNSWSILVELTP